MAKGIKIATIGGGSSYTPELMEGFIKRYEELPIREIWLVDVEEGKEKLEIVSQMSQRMWMLLHMKSRSMQLWIGKKH